MPIPLFEISDWSTDLMFCEDKHGNTLFFPWGERHKGFILSDRTLKKKAARFFRWSMILLFLFMMVSTHIALKEPWSSLVGIVYWACSWFLAWFLYAHWVTRDLMPASKSYREIILEKLDPEGEELWGDQASQRMINRPSRVTFNTWKGLASLKHLAGFVAFNLAILGLFMSFMLADTLSGKSSSDYFTNLVVTSIVFFFMGLIGFLSFRQFIAEKRKVRDWILTGSGYIILMVFSWGLIFFVLYQGLILPLFK
jgi:hypothetical protein